MANMPVTPSDVADTIPASTGSICEKLDKLWSLANKMSDAWAFMFKEDGTLTADFLSLIFPSGAVVFWPKATSIPAGFVAANGAILSVADYPTLAGIFGVTYGGNGTTTFGVPDFSDKFLVGASGTKAAGTTGGAATVTLGVPNIPQLDITFKAPTTKLVCTVSSGGDVGVNSGGENKKLDVGDAFNPLGTATPDAVNIQNPYFSGLWIVKT